MGHTLNLVLLGAAIATSFGLTVAEADQASPRRARSFVGYAYDQKTGDLVFVERHREIEYAAGGVEVETAYYDSLGEQIAIRTSDFTVDPLLPEFLLEDLRTGYREGMRRTGDELVVYRNRPGRGRQDQRDVEVVEDLVADAGFDRLVTTIWDDLMEGRTKQAEFLVPSRLRSIGFRFFKHDEGTIDGEPTVTIRIRFDNALARLVAGSIDVTYHRERRLLMRYEGLSNISDGKGGNRRVRIEFPLEERSDWLKADDQT